MRGKKLVCFLLAGILCFGMDFTSQATSASEAKKEASKAKEKAETDEQRELYAQKAEKSFASAVEAIKLKDEKEKVFNAVTAEK